MKQMLSLLFSVRIIWKKNKEKKLDNAVRSAKK